MISGFDIQMEQAPDIPWPLYWAVGQLLKEEYGASGQSYALEQFYIPEEVRQSVTERAWGLRWDISPQVSLHVPIVGD